MNEVESALVLTDAEWEDLAVICRVYQRVVSSHSESDIDRFQERLDLVDRVLEATS